MYLFQPIEYCALSGLSRIYIPLCIYFNFHKQGQERKPSLFTFHYVSISTCWKYNKPAMAMIFTFHYVSISTCAVVRLVRCNISFTFHYVSISTDFRTISGIRNSIYIPLCIYFNGWHNKFCVTGSEYLHSTMYLFQRHQVYICNESQFIYIPLCIYFNPS